MMQEEHEEAPTSSRAGTMDDEDGHGEAETLSTRKAPFPAASRRNLKEVGESARFFARAAP